MIDSEKLAFKNMMENIMALYYKPALDKTLLRVWWHKLSDYDFKTVSKAFDIFTDSPNKPPTPADIKQLCKSINSKRIVPMITKQISAEKKMANQQRLRNMLSELHIKLIK